MKYANKKIGKISDHHLAAGAYVLPLLYFITPISTSLSLLPSLLIVCSGIGFVILFKQSDLVRFHGILSAVVNGIPMMLLYVISMIFRLAALVTSEIGLAVYSMIYMCCNLLVLILPVFCMILAYQHKDVQLPVISKIIRKGLGK